MTIGTVLVANQHRMILDKNEICLSANEQKLKQKSRGGGVSVPRGMRPMNLSKGDMGQYRASVHDTTGTMLLNMKFQPFYMIMQNWLNLAFQLVNYFFFDKQKECGGRLV